MDSGTLGQKVEALVQLVEDEYVDDFGKDSISTMVIQSLMSSLDPHSCYFSASEIEAQSVDVRGNFEGIGAMLRSFNDTIGIVGTMQDSPARRAGLRAGDRIITVDGDTVSGVKMSIEDVVGRIRGPHGENVDLGILRYGNPTVHHYGVSRDVILSQSVVYSGMLNSSTGYIRIRNFSEMTYVEFHDAMSKLKNSGMKKLILDLRSNGGGVMESAVNICNEFLEKGDLIVYTKGAHTRKSKIEADGDGMFKKGEVVVMINEFSASASEIVSGALQDNDRAVIVGRRSFGKGLVQRQFDFTDGSAVWLTVARYYTPSGRCIQRPYDRGTDEYYADFIESLSKNETDSSLVSITDTTRYFTKKGKVVYGGGGIYPDRLLPYFSDKLLSYYNTLVNNQIVEYYAFNYVTQNYMSLIKKYPNEDAFVAYYKVTSADRNAIIDAGLKAGFEPNKASIDKYGKNIDTLFKAYIAEFLYDTEAFYRIYVTMDTEVQQTLKL